MITLSIPMKINSEKVHSVRYDAVDKDAAVTSVYVMKKDLAKPIPQEITCKIEMVYDKEIKE